MQAMIDLRQNRALHVLAVKAAYTYIHRQTLESSCWGPFRASRGAAPSYGVVAQASPQAKDHCPTPCSSCVSRSPIMSLHAGPH